MLTPYFRNGGMIGVTLDFATTDRYVLGGSTGADITFVDSTSTVNSTTLTLPTGLQQDDMVLVVSASDTNLTPMAPTGYTTIYDERPGSTGAMAAYKFMGSTPDTQVTGLSAEARAPYLAMVFRGVDTTNPLDVPFTEIATAGTGMPDPPSITTVTDGCMIVGVGHLDDDNITATAPAGYSLGGTQSGTTNGATVMAAYLLQSTAGPEDPGVFGGGGNDQNEARTIALRPGVTVELGNFKNSGIWDVTGVLASIIAGGSTPSYELGLTPSLFSVTGTNDAWTQQTVDISGYPGATVRLVFRYQNGDSFIGDIQLDQIDLDGNVYSFENQTHSFETSSQDNSATYAGVSWSALTVTENLDGYWQVDQGGTPSNNTGRTDAADGSYYVYAETSAPADQAGYNFWLRSPEIVLGSSPTLTFFEARNGAGIGTLDVFLEVIA